MTEPKNRDERIREIIVRDVLKHNKNCDCLICRKNGRLDQALQAIKDVQRVSEEEIREIIVRWLTQIVNIYLQPSNDLNHIEIAKEKINDLAHAICEKINGR